MTAAQEILHALKPGFNPLQRELMHNPMRVDAALQIAVEAMEEMRAAHEESGMLNTAGFMEIKLKKILSALKG